MANALDLYLPHLYQYLHLVTTLSFKWFFFFFATHSVNNSLTFHNNIFLNWTLFLFFLQFMECRSVDDIFFFKSLQIETCFFSVETCILYFLFFLLLHFDLQFLNFFFLLTYGNWKNPILFQTNYSTHLKIKKRNRRRWFLFVRWLKKLVQIHNLIWEKWWRKQKMMKITWKWAAQINTYTNLYSVLFRKFTQLHFTLFTKPLVNRARYMLVLICERRWCFVLSSDRNKLMHSITVNRVNSKMRKATTPQYQKRSVNLYA